MSVLPHVRRLRRCESGFTVVEMLIAAGIMMVVTGAIFELMNPSRGVFEAQPERADLQQRLRVGAETLRGDLVMAGAGMYAGQAAGALTYFFAPIYPYRAIGTDSDPARGVFYRTDAISLIYVPPTPSQTTISDPMPPNSAEIKVNPQPNCPGGRQDQLCGFEVGMRLVIFDDQGNWDTFTVTQVQDAAAHLQHRGQDFTVAYAANSNVTQVKTATYYLKTDNAARTYQLMYYDGYDTDLPVVDDVVALEFEYWGDPNPPQLTGRALTDNIGPWTTYGPKPPPLGVARGGWPAGENCAFRVQNGQHVPRLADLGLGSAQVRLTQAMLTDGPWCPDANKPNRFDADLFRVQRIRVRMRVQTAKDNLRGPVGALFQRGGTATSNYRFVPDQEIRFDIAPRNLNLGR
jgi:hypothetical protein